MDNQVFFFPYDDELLERLVAQELVRLAVGRLAVEGGFSRAIDADLYSSHADAVARHWTEVDGIASSTAPMAAKLSLVNEKLASSWRADDNTALVPFLSLRHALAVHLSSDTAQPALQQAAVCDLVIAYALSGQGDVAKRLWEANVRTSDETGGLGHVMGFVETAIGVVMPATSRDKTLPGVSSSLIACAPTIPFAVRLLSDSDARDEFNTAVTASRYEALRIAQLTAVLATKRLAVLAEKERKLKQKVARLAKDTRVASSPEALQAAVATATTLSESLGRVREAQVTTCVALRDVIQLALSCEPIVDSVFTHHAGFALALFALIWNHLEDPSLSVDCGNEQALRDAMGRAVLNSSFASSSTRRVLCWCLLWLTRGKHEARSLNLDVALCSDSMTLPRTLAATTTGKQSVSPDDLEEALLADPELPTSCTVPT